VIVQTIQKFSDNHKYRQSKFVGDEDKNCHTSRLPNLYNKAKNKKMEAFIVLYISHPWRLAVVSLIARIYGDRYEGKQANKEGKKLGPRRIYKRRNGQRRRILSERSLRNVFLGDTGAPFQVSRTKFRTATRM